MNNLNSVLIEGTLVKDPVLYYWPKGTAMCTFSVASSRSTKESGEVIKDTSFFDVTTSARQAEVCAEYLKKGRGVRVVGHLKQDRWTDADGIVHSKVGIVAEHVEFKPEYKKQEETE